MQEVEEVQRALASLTRGLFLMTAGFQNKRSGAMVHWVQPCATEPPLVCVALRTGHSIKTIIRDSHCFALCGVAEEDRLLLRKFGGERTPEQIGDPFDCLETQRMVTGAPVLKRSAHVLDCEVVRHLDLEADHSLYIGHVMGARCFDVATNGTANGAASHA